MATFAPPIRRGDFLYSSVLYVDPGNGSQHPRASIAELASYLRPEAPNLYSKGRKPAPAAPAKDQVWHFYSAQLLHYGLPVTKDKNAAKVRLLNAMNQIKLEVPAWILNLEGELKNEWDAANRKLKKSARAKSNKGSASGSQSGHGFREIQASNSGVNVTINLPSFPVQAMLGHSVYEQLSNNPPNPTSAKRKRADHDVPSPQSMPKKVARTKKEPVPKRSPIKQEPTTKRSTPTIKNEYHTSQAPRTPSRARVKQEQHYSASQRYNNPSSPSINPSAYTSPSSNNPIVLSGLYEIDCPTATSIFAASNLDLTLAYSPPHTTWWATFRWGAWDGIICMKPGPTYNVFDEPCSLGWRLHDLETGKLTFGRKCTGSLVFRRNGTVEGCLFEVPGVGDLEFEGWRVDGAAVQDDLREEWDRFVREAYKR